MLYDCKPVFNSAMCWSLSTNSDTCVRVCVYVCDCVSDRGRSGWHGDEERVDMFPLLCSFHAADNRPLLLLELVWDPTLELGRLWLDRKPIWTARLIGTKARARRR